ncbi:DHA2 family efflux MFS transporter permease subunit [Neokomagataea thailandica]|uniref:Multidrug ABC transporter n=1 Tax=Neokomagataea tanensis NBRC 106556 TaxID=1223519 RepID=A0ABQ0QGV3_9PROT|nr:MULTISPECIES: DHA2 family efflux MFS transporter permease subunit [Neokomagataea]GBR44268.1 multidrug ABC transporter [Neokomagataea tanensis NBRC 106556]
MSALDKSKEEWKPKHNPWLIAVVVTMAAFMEVLDTTIVNVALPHIAGSLGGSYDDSTWALTAYLVANGIVLTISGWLSRLFGRKRYFLICIVMFTVSSFLCGLAQSLPMLVVFRLMQGFFGGGLQPSQQSIILDTFPPEKRGAAFGLTAIATIVGPVLGPLLGGFLTDDYSWRWVFFVNIPFGIMCVLAVSALVEDPPWERRRRMPIDGIGIGLITLGLGCLELACDRGEDEDWFGSHYIVLMAILGAVGIVGAIFWMLKARQPLLRLEVFKDRNFATSMLLMSMVGALLYSSSVIIPQFAQQVQGYTATTSGLLLAPGGVAVIVLIPIVGQLMKVIPVRYIIACGFTLMGLSMFQAAHLSAQIDFATLIQYRVSQTAALAFLFVPISTVAYSTLPRELNADASALFSMCRNYLGSLAISLSTAAVVEARQRHQNDMAGHMITGRQPYTDYLNAVQKTAQDHGLTPAAAHGFAVHRLMGEFSTQTAMLAYNEVFRWIGILALMVVPLCALLAPAAKKRSGDAPVGGH